MAKIAFVVASALGLMAVTANPAAAQSARTFVSHAGADSGACTLTAPCRSFAYAASQTAASGELVVLDPGGYGQVTLTQSISIVNDGVGTASITVPAGGNGVTINAGSSDTVQLRGLEIDGGGAGTNNGVYLYTGGSLTVVNCVIRHLQVGLNLRQPYANAQVFDSLISDNSSNGITQNAESLELRNTKVIDNTGNGIVTTGGGNGYSHVAITSSSIYGNGYGINSGNTDLTVESSSIFNNSVGIYLFGAYLYLDNSLVARNTTGIAVSEGSSANTFGDNRIYGNGTNVANGSLTATSPE